MKDDYRPHSEWPQMLSKKKVQKKRQLRQPRWNVQYSMGHPLPSPQPSRRSGDDVPEYDPPATTTFQAQCNCLNQAFCHSCSDYCYRCTNVQVTHYNVARFYLSPLTLSLCYSVISLRCATYGHTGDTHTPLGSCYASLPP